MKLTILKVLCLIITFVFLIGEIKGSDIVIGKLYTIHSEILKGDRVIQVSLPRNYKTSKIDYPVLYILDGQIHFTNGVAIQHSLETPSEIPEMIIIGIQNTYPQRTDLKWSKKDDYLSFFEQELIPFVENTFRATEERLLFGWEMGAYISSYSFFHESQLFNGAILSSGATTQEKMIDEFKKLKFSHNKYLLIVNSDKDIYSIEGSNTLADHLNNIKPENLTWAYEKYDNESHESLGYLSLYQGLRYYYHDFNTVAFSSIKEYEDLGGIPYLKSFYKQRGARYGYSGEIENSSKNNLIWLAWNRDNYKYFDFFMDEFKEVLSTKRYSSEYWQNRFGQFYLKHKNYNKAIHYFNVARTKYKETARVFNGLGKAYLAGNNVNQAFINFERAVEIAKESDDVNLELYLEDLNKVNNIN